MHRADPARPAPVRPSAAAIEIAGFVLLLAGMWGVVVAAYADQIGLLR